MEVRRLGEATDAIFLGLSLARQPKGPLLTTTAAIVNVKDIEQGFLPNRTVLHETEVPEGSQTERFRLKSGDILVSARGSVKVAGVRDEHVGVIAGANLIVVRPGKVLAAPLVLAFLRHPSTQAALERSSSGTTVQSINVKTVAELRVSIPLGQVQDVLSQVVTLADEQYAAARLAAEIRRQIAQEVAIRALAA